MNVFVHDGINPPLWYFVLYILSIRRLGLKFICSFFYEFGHINDQIQNMSWFLLLLFIQYNWTAKIYTPQNVHLMMMPMLWTVVYVCGKAAYLRLKLLAHVRHFGDSGDEMLDGSVTRVTWCRSHPDISHTLLKSLSMQIFGTLPSKWLHYMYIVIPLPPDQLSYYVLSHSFNQEWIKIIGHRIIKTFYLSIQT